ncbi:DEAD/DEAH box helicase [Vibrio alginolyticus]|uniref:DEAD/DEAH box helicase n=1 Tax=Vibrio alginolyticus TaxID=663 RepID=UPI000803B319|nr:DEAD/DEAH box helicase [Vibrio alginolyticus]ANP67168.1 helicase [Vibrio alginolyticus]
MSNKNTSYAPGMRVEIRNEEWTIRCVDQLGNGNQLLICEGVSELVRGKESRFITELEQDIAILDPAQTRLVEDDSANYKASLLYIESMLRQRTPTDEKIYMGHKAAMDSLPYQLDPTKQALQQPRQRILIADNVGLGKTLEAGILMSELMRRGKGKRILVLAVKSMLVQFQKEMWNRFSIPLTRLDSTGIQKVRNRIPTNHNPFYYYDKTIISIDTLKQDVEYRHYLEQAYWDIIVIDEAHNVAERGGSSQRSRLAKLLSQRSDTLIMLSATPHDGKPESFASLMNMLDATAITDKSNYKHEDFKDKGLVVRRFKHDVKDQIAGEFPERHIESIHAAASQQEQYVYELLAEAKIGKDNGGPNSGRLLKVSFEKALFSSPMACHSVVNNRINKLERQEDPELQTEINSLYSLKAGLESIDASSFGKYQALLSTINDKKAPALGWKPTKSDDRLVIFTESIPTLDFLYDNLKRDLNLQVVENDIDKSQIVKLHGGMADTEIMSIVESFGKAQSKIRLLVCSDVASEGINLHYFSHKMIHFDIPWSLMVFQQRNGRIDRYGQQVQPQIRYLMTKKDDTGLLLGDARVYDILVNKDEQAQTNIGDPSEFMDAYTQEEQEKVVADVISDPSKGINVLDAMLSLGTVPPKEISNNPLHAFTPQSPVSQTTTGLTGQLSSLYSNELSYCEAALSYLKQNGQRVEYTARKKEQVLELTAPNDLQYRFNQLAPEVKPENWHFVLSENVATLSDEIARCRADQDSWPKIHYLWQLNPVVQWLNDKLQSVAFRRHEAPILRIPGHVQANTDHYLISGLYPNRKSHPVVNPWLVVTLNAGEFAAMQTLEEFLKALPLADLKLANPMSEGRSDRLQQQLPEVIEHAKEFLEHERKHADSTINSKLNHQLDELDKLRTRRVQQMELKFEASAQLEGIKQSSKERQQREIDQVFESYMQWMEDTMTIEPHPYIQVVAVITGEEK